MDSGITNIWVFRFIMSAIDEACKLGYTVMKYKFELKLQATSNL